MTTLKSEQEFIDFVSQRPVSIVIFTAKWCGICQQLKPEFAKAANHPSVGDYIALMPETDRTENFIQQQLGIEGYPTIRVFTPANPAGSDYPGGRTADEIVGYIADRLSQGQQRSGRAGSPSRRRNSSYYTY